GGDVVLDRLQQLGAGAVGDAAVGAQRLAAGDAVDAAVGLVEQRVQRGELLDSLDLAVGPGDRLQVAQGNAAAGECLRHRRVEVVEVEHAVLGRELDELRRVEAAAGNG